MLLLPAEFVVQQLFNPGKKHRAECKPHRECSPSHGVAGEHCPLQHDPQLF